MADPEPREGAHTAEARKGRSEIAGETRRISWQPVFVLAGDGRPLAPCHPARARRLFKRGKAEVVRAVPFAVRLKRSVPQAEIDKSHTDLKIDVGAKHAGFALVRGDEVLLAGELRLRTDIKERMDWRRICRRSRRNRKTRYRKPRFDNRRRREGRLPPSLRHRVEATAKLARMLVGLVPVRRIVAETAAFDVHRLVDPEVHGKGYQQGALYRTDLRAYLFRKHEGKCAYCKGPLGPGWQADHVMPRSRGGSDRPFNRVAACEKCNSAKGNRTAEEFGHPEVEAFAKVGYAPAAIVTAIRLELVGELKKIVPTVETDGALTKRNRLALGLPKTHANDAVCLLEAPKEPVFPAKECVFVARPCGTRRLVNGPSGGHAIRLPREVKGFRQWDAVKWNGRLCYVKGRRKTGSFLLSDIEGNKVKDGVGAKRLALVRRASTLQGEIRDHIVHHIVGETGKGGGAASSPD